MIDFSWYPKGNQARDGIVYVVQLRIHQPGGSLAGRRTPAKWLTDAGFSVNANSFYGKPTKQAVRAFQKDKVLRRMALSDRNRGMPSLTVEI